MLRDFLRRKLSGPISRFANRISSAPVKEDVFASLSQLLSSIRAGKTDCGVRVPFDISTSKFIIFSDQHKGARDDADDFAMAAGNYTAALHHYFDNGFSFVNLGDCEELWENTPDAVMKKNGEVLSLEARFQTDNRYYRVFGNHDLEWKFPFQQALYLRKIFGATLKVYEGVELTTNYKEKEWSIFLAHGHQGDKRSDGNPFSTWVVAAIWTPIQRFLGINVNTTADSFELVDAHNIIMYNWSAEQQRLVFISGHTHKPVFASYDHIDLLNIQIQQAKEAGDNAAAAHYETELKRYEAEYTGKKMVKTMAYPSYFNSGCCCFDDGDITGIEIAEGYIRLVKWLSDPNGKSVRTVLEESPLSYIFDKLADS
ncbi:MAG: metallophosphoesterase family protein [Bacteroidota bacterium]|nr:metallophosphoesterase family protein [Bacteroidota bacterium]